VQHAFGIPRSPGTGGRGHAPPLVGVARPEITGMPLRKGEERLRKLQRMGVELQYLVPQIEPEIRGNLVVAGAAGVKALADGTVTLRKPELHRRVDVLVLRADDQCPGPRGAERRAERALHPAELRLAGEPCPPETDRVPQASEDVPPE